MPDISRLVIEVDSSGFLKAEGNSKTFEALLKKLEGTAGRTESSVKGLGKEFAAFQLIVNKLPGPLKSIVSGVMGLVSPATAAASAVIELTDAAFNFAKGSIEAFGEFEMIKTNLELVMGSAAAAGTTFNELRELAAKTPFSLPGVAQSASMLRQAGVAADDLVSTIEMLGNVSGGNMERFNRIAYNYTQVLQKGVMDARDTREFANNLVPINQALKELGITGKLTADDMTAAFRRMTQEGGMFFNAINRQGETMIGKTEQLTEAWREFQATWAEGSGLGQVWKKILDHVTEALKINSDEMQRNIELRKSLGILKENPYAPEANVTVYDTQIKEQQAKLADYLGSIGYDEETLRTLKEQTEELRNQLVLREGIGSLGAADLNRILDEYNAQLAVVELYKNQMNELKRLKKPFDDILSQEKARTAEIEKQKKLTEDIKRRQAEVMNSINDWIAKTPEGQIQVLEDQRRVIQQQLDEYVNGTWQLKDVVKREDGSVGYSDKELRLVKGTQDEINKATSAIAAITEEIKIITDKSLKPSKETPKLADWKVVLGNTFNFTPTYSTTGRQAAEEYKEYLSDLDERLSSFVNNEKGMTVSDMLGLDIAALRLDSLKEKLQQLIMSPVGNFKMGDDSVNTLVDEILPLLGKNYSSELAKQLDILKMTTEELRRQELIKLGISNDTQDQIIKNLELLDILKGQDILGRKLGEEKTIALANMLKESPGGILDGLKARGNEFGTDLGNMFHFESEEFWERFGETALDVGRLLFDNNWFNDVVDDWKRVFTDEDGEKEFWGDLKETFRDLGTALSPFHGAVGDYTWAALKEAGYQFAKGTDVGAFAAGFKNSGSVEVGVINMFINALANALGSIEAINMILNPITLMLKELSPIIKTILLPLLLLVFLIKGLGEAIMWLLDTITFGAFSAAAEEFDKLAAVMSESNEEREKEAESLRELNEQYQKLIESIQENEEYYLKKRRELNADFAIENMSVNDMILTPHGNFSTNPNDYIIATKHPETLGGAVSAPVFINIVNNSSATVTEDDQTDPDGTRRIMVLVDQVVQTGIATGKYDGAFNRKQVRDSGKRVSG